MDTSSMINSAVIIALMLLAVSMFLLATYGLQVLSQLNRTLASVERLTDTTREEMAPTLKEVRDVLDGVNQIRALTTQRVSDVGHKVEDVADTFNSAVGTAQKHGSVWGAGLLAGVKAYLTPNHNNQKQITMDKGEHHELKQ